MSVLDKYEKYLVKFRIDCDVYRRGLSCDSGWHNSQEKLREAIDAIEAEGHEVVKVHCKTDGAWESNDRYDLDELREPAL